MRAAQWPPFAICDEARRYWLRCTPAGRPTTKPAGLPRPCVRYRRNEKQPGLSHMERLRGGCNDPAGGPQRPSVSWTCDPERDSRSAAELMKAADKFIPLKAHGILFVTVAAFLPVLLAQNPNTRFKSCSITLKRMQRGVYRMTTKEKLNLAGLALGITATFAWIGVMGFALSQAISWLL